MNSAALLDDFRRALAQFKDALAMPVDNDVVKAGCIQYFEFTFELAWKSIKRLAEDEGVSDVTSPKSALKAAFARGWLEDEELWLDMLAARNRMAHTYHAADALQIFDRLSSFVNAFEALADRLAHEG